MREYPISNIGTQLSACIESFEPPMTAADVQSAVPVQRVIRGKQYKPCSHCGYQRKRQLKKGTACPKCGFKKPSIWTLIKRAVRGVKTKPYKARNKDAKILLNVIN